MKNILRGTLSIFLGVSIVTSSFPAQAAIFGRKEKETTNLPKAANSEQLLRDLITKVTDNFNQLNLLMSQQQYQAAMTLAKQSLDEARIKTGIEPKSNRREIISVPKDTFAEDYDKLGKKLSEFPVHAQNGIMTAIEKHRGGYYLDLLNLLKRTNLIYIQAFHQSLKQSSNGLLQEDKEKIRRDINAVRAIPMHLKDPGSSALLLVFDYEVANSDQNYLFNRELKTYLLREGQDLGYIGEYLETTIDRELEQHINQIKNAFVSAEGRIVNSQKQRKAESENSRQTADNKTPFEHPNYLDCKQLTKSISYCLKKYEQINFSNRNFRICLKEYGYSPDDDSYYYANYAKVCEQYAKF